MVFNHKSWPWQIHYACGRKPMIRGCISRVSHSWGSIRTPTVCHISNNPPKKDHTYINSPLPFPPMISPQCIIMKLLVCLGSVFIWFTDLLLDGVVACSSGIQCFGLSETFYVTCNLYPPKCDVLCAWPLMRRIVHILCYVFSQGCRKRHCWWELVRTWVTWLVGRRDNRSLMGVRIIVSGLAIMHLDSVCC